MNSTSEEEEARDAAGESGREVGVGRPGLMRRHEQLLSSAGTKYSLNPHIAKA